MSERVNLPVRWIETDGMFVLYINVSGDPDRRLDDDGLIRMGSIHRHDDGTFSVWTSCVHSIRGPRERFPNLRDAKLAFLETMEAGT